MSRSIAIAAWVGALALVVVAVFTGLNYTEAREARADEDAQRGRVLTVACTDLFASLRYTNFQGNQLEGALLEAVLEDWRGTCAPYARTARVHIESWISEYVREAIASTAP